MSPSRLILDSPAVLPRATCISSLHSTAASQPQARFYPNTRPSSPEDATRTTRHASDVQTQPTAMKRTRTNGSALELITFPPSSSPNLTPPAARALTLFTAVPSGFHLQASSATYTPEPFTSSGKVTCRDELTIEPSRPPLLLLPLLLFPPTPSATDVGVSDSPYHRSPTCPPATSAESRGEVGVGPGGYDRAR